MLDDENVYQFNWFEIVIESESENKMSDYECENDENGDLSDNKIFK